MRCQHDAHQVLPLLGNIIKPCCWVAAASGFDTLIPLPIAAICAGTYPQPVPGPPIDEVMLADVPPVRMV